MSLQGHYLLPHPPIVIPEVGKGEEEKIKATSKSMHFVGQEISHKAPGTIVIVTPHGVMFEDAVALSYEDEMQGDFEHFGITGITMQCKINKALTSKIYELSFNENIPVVMATNELLREHGAAVRLDHGAMVPLYFINQYYTDYKLVHITYAPIDDMSLYKFGMTIEEAARELNEKTVFIASGDLSHKLKKDGPYEYSPLGEKFDTEFLGLLKAGDAAGVFGMDKEVVCGAGECGRRSVAMLLGTLEGKKFNGELLSYEGTFGVGYGVMRYNIIAEDQSMLDKFKVLQDIAQKKKHEQKDPYVRLARESLTSYLNTGKVLSRMPDYVTEEMKNNKRGAFVSLKKHGSLRGCIGTIFPVTDSIAEEIVRNAVEAGINDPRFYEVNKKELLDIDFSVDVLTEPEPAQIEELDPKIYGVIVKSQGRTGLLLPDLEGVDTVGDQITIALEKAGINPEEDYSLQKFQVIRHKEAL